MPNQRIGTAWWRENLIGPLVAGIIVAFVSVVLPKAFEYGRLAVSYEGPIDYLVPSKKREAIQIGCTVASQIYGYKVRIRNSGLRELENVQVILEFEKTWSDFSILTLARKPGYHFGGVESKDIDVFARELKYSLLRRNSEDTIHILTNRGAGLNIQVIGKGVDEEIARFSDSEPLLGLSALLGAIAGAQLCLLLRPIWNKLRHRKGLANME